MQAGFTLLQYQFLPFPEQKDYKLGSLVFFGYFPFSQIHSIG